MALFLPSAVLCVASALTGIQSFDYDSRIGMTIIYWRGYWRVQKIIAASMSFPTLCPSAACGMTDRMTQSATQCTAAAHMML
jgi:hypothetical protein